MRNIKQKANNIKLYSCLITLLILFTSCDNFISNKKNEILEQSLAYDSLYNKFHKFDVQLYTTIEFDKKELKRKEYNDFSIIINKDTFGLVPTINDLKIKTAKNKIKIEFYSQIDFSSKIYKNDSLSNILNNSYIITSEGIRVEKSKNYKLKSLISLGYKTKDIKFSPQKPDM